MSKESKKEEGVSRACDPRIAALGLEGPEGEDEQGAGRLNPGRWKEGELGTLRGQRTETIVCKRAKRRGLGASEGRKKRR